MIGFIFLTIIVLAFLSGIFAPNTDSVSYRLGKGTGNKVRKLGEWIMKDD